MKSLLCLAAAISFAIPADVSAHCQVPCGIVGDNNVISSMHTDHANVEKPHDLLHSFEEHFGEKEVG